MNEKRHFTRIQFDANAVIKSSDEIWDTKVIDISMKGALIEKPDANFENDQPVELNLTLSDNTTHLTMEGRIAHVDDDTLGLVCEHIDVDSVSHLRRIVELNTGSQDLLERELEALTHYTDRDSFH
ncbi:MAG: PilZ domain-containing protein [Pseudomonadales bacterium]|nr:PilZ domain-containing protein [Pseudomonadales bacterium]